MATPLLRVMILWHVYAMRALRDDICAISSQQTLRFFFFAVLMSPARRRAPCASADADIYT